MDELKVREIIRQEREEAYRSGLKAHAEQKAAREKADKAKFEKERAAFKIKDDAACAVICAASSKKKDEMKAHFKARNDTRREQKRIAKQQGSIQKFFGGKRPQLASGEHNTLKG